MLESWKALLLSLFDLEYSYGVMYDLCTLSIFFVLISRIVEGGIIFYVEKKKKEKIFHLTVIGLRYHGNNSGDTLMLTL